MSLQKFRNKFRIQPARLRYYDYTRNGFYFITICIKDRENYFGKIIQDEIKLSNIGKIVSKFWQDIPKHHKFVLLDEWIIMPDHIHGIIVINNFNKNIMVETRHGASLQKHNQFGKLYNNSLQAIINHFKGSVTRWANQNNIPFAWQSRYYDRIVRNERELNSVRRYIRNNPRMWHIQKT